jgi:hypothetical protein
VFAVAEDGTGVGRASVAGGISTVVAGWGQVGGFVKVRVVGSGVFSD